jgi:hypothetical protein
MHRIGRWHSVFSNQSDMVDSGEAYRCMVPFNDSLQIAWHFAVARQNNYLKAVMTAGRWLGHETLDPLICGIRDKLGISARPRPNGIPRRSNVPVPDEVVCLVRVNYNKPWRGPTITKPKATRCVGDEGRRREMRWKGLRGAEVQLRCVVCYLGALLSQRSVTELAEGARKKGRERMRRRVPEDLRQ